MAATALHRAHLPLCQTARRPSGRSAPSAPAAGTEWILRQGRARERSRRPEARKARRADRFRRRSTALAAVRLALGAANKPRCPSTRARAAAGPARARAPGSRLHPLQILDEVRETLIDRG